MSWTPYDRDRPKKFIDETIRIFNERDGKTIIEIGCMRMRITHPIEENHHQCCCDGHSSLLFARTGKTFYSCDVDPKSVRLAAEAIQSYPNSRVLVKDGIKFLQDFGDKIDLFFLDAWDVNHPQCAEKHLEAYNTAKKVLHANSVVLIDDTDVDIVDKKLQLTKLEYGGKGRLLVPKMVEDGWKVIMKGRCTLLCR
jgi:hypothetical protein